MKFPLPLDRRYDWLAFFTLATSLVIVTYFFNQLPERIPIHFNGKGEVDGWGNKYTLWTLPAIGLFMYVFLGLMARLLRAKHSNWSSMQPKAGEEVAVRQLNLAMLGGLRAMIMLFFTYTSWETIQIALGRWQQGNSWSLTIFLVALFGFILYYTYQISRRSK